MKKNGFTLVELLAVIVILAIILVIAVPKIANTITNARKGALESSAKLIAAGAEREKLLREATGDNSTTYDCADFADDNSQYSGCTITWSSSTAQVTLTGADKFAGYYICNGTRTSATATTTACS